MTSSNTVSRRPVRRRFVWMGVAVIAIIAVVVTFVVVSVSRQGGAAFEASVLSSRADMVTGGNALVGVVSAEGGDVSGVEVVLNGQEVTDVFQPAGEGRLVGLVLVTGLSEGVNELTVGTGGEALEITNHSIDGPVFSGPHQQPFVCETEAFGLGAAIDENCNAETRVTYYYKSTSSDVLEPIDGQAVPDDVDQTTTIQGETVPYVVRLEQGTINRAVYEIAMLHVPDTDLPSATTLTPG